MKLKENYYKVNFSMQRESFFKKEQLSNKQLSRNFQTKILNFQIQSTDHTPLENIIKNKQHKKTDEPFQFGNTRKTEIQKMNNDSDPTKQKKPNKADKNSRTSRK